MRFHANYLSACGEGDYVLINLNQGPKSSATEADDPHEADGT